jgi:predicted secreted protein
MRPVATLVSRLADERSRRVVFLSHCLLNENTRYLGGAFRPGVVEEVIEPFVREGVGIYQMPCPEQRAWGGVLKRYVLPFYGSAGVRRALLPVLTPLFLAYTRWVYASIARAVARDVEDYVRSGFQVVGIVGVGASPSCGVCTTLDARRSISAAASCPLARIDRSYVNRVVVEAAVIRGEGIFMTELRRQLDRRGIDVPFYEHDLVLEMHAAAAVG